MKLFEVDRKILRLTWPGGPVNPSTLLAAIAAIEAVNEDLRVFSGEGWNINFPCQSTFIEWAD